jgi:hypothetical protein
MLGRRVGWGEMASVLVLIVVLTETTECLRGWRELRRVPSGLVSEEEESSDVPSEPSSSRSVSSSSFPEPRALGAGDAEMSVETDVLKALIAFLAASARDVMTAGPGKMWALTMGAHFTIERGPAVYWSWTVSVKEGIIG